MKLTLDQLSSLYNEKLLDQSSDIDDWLFLSLHSADIDPIDFFTHFMKWRKEVYKPQDQYFVTFTLRKEYWGTDMEDKLEKKINELPSHKGKAIKRLWYVKELGSGDNPHFHCLVYSDRKLTKSLFDSIQKQFGNIDLKKVKNDNGIQNYMSKQNNIVSVI